MSDSRRGSSSRIKRRPTGRRSSSANQRKSTKRNQQGGKRSSKKAKQTRSDNKSSAVSSGGYSLPAPSPPTSKQIGGAKGTERIMTMAIIMGKAKRVMDCSFQLRQALVMTMKKM